MRCLGVGATARASVGVYNERGRRRRARVGAAGRAATCSGSAGTATWTTSTATTSSSTTSGRATSASSSRTTSRRSSTTRCAATSSACTSASATSASRTCASTATAARSRRRRPRSRREELKGMSAAEVGELDADWMIELLGIPVSATRRKCALLNLKVVRGAGHGRQQLAALAPSADLGAARARLLLQRRLLDRGPRPAPPPRPLARRARCGPFVRWPERPREASPVQRRRRARRSWRGRGRSAWRRTGRRRRSGGARPGSTLSLLSVTPKLTVKRGVSPGCARASAARRRSITSTAWKRSSSGRISTNSSPPQRAIVSSSRSETRGDLREQPQRAVADLVPVGVVELLEAVEVGQRQREHAPLAQQLAQALLGHAPVHEAGQPVGRGLQLGLLEGAHGSDARAGLPGERRAGARPARAERVRSGPVVCSTPSERPMKLTGTHTAEHAPPGRSRRCGQALSDSLESNTTALPRRTATQENGERTGHAGRPALRVGRDAPAGSRGSSPTAAAPSASARRMSSTSRAPRPRRRRLPRRPSPAPR